MTFKALSTFLNIGHFENCVAWIAGLMYHLLDKLSTENDAVKVDDYRLAAVKATECCEALQIGCCNFLKLSK